jgi:stage III sporulation protein AH
MVSSLCRAQYSIHQLYQAYLDQDVTIWGEYIASTEWDNLSSEEKKAAVEKVAEIADISEKEIAAENLIMAKGYKDVVVTYTDGYVDVIVVAEEMDDTTRAQIEDIVKRKMEVSADKITINIIDA